MVEVVGHLEAVVGHVATGWAALASGASTPLEIEVLVGGQPVGYAITSMYRADAEASGLAAVAGFKAMLDCPRFSDGERLVTARVAGIGQLLQGAVPLRASDVIPVAAGLRPAPDDPKAEPAPFAPLAIVIYTGQSGNESVSASLAALAAQTDPEWELFLIGAADSLPPPAWRDPRIHSLASLGDLALDLQAALARVRSRHMLIAEPWALLEPDAVGRLRQAAAGQSDIVYGDEMILDELGGLQDARLCPAFSHDLFLAKPFFGGCYLVAVETFGQASIDERVRSTSDPALILRLLERAATISHIPALLCRVPATMRYPPASAAAVEGHLYRIGRPGAVLPLFGSATWRIDYRDDRGKVLIVIPTKNAHALVRQCISSICATTNCDEVDIVLVDHESSEPASLEYFRSLHNDVRVVPYTGVFNFAAINNQAVASTVTDHRYVLFLNNDVEALSTGWLEHMRGLAGRRDVGIVGSTLLYDNGAIQHGGVILGLYGLADHSHKHLMLDKGQQRLPGYLDSMAATRDYSAVTGACMMMRMDVFIGVGGFDEAFSVDYNDIDLCLRVRSRGLKVLLDTHAVLRHHESATRDVRGNVLLEEAASLFRQRWGDLLTTGDSFYHPGLSLSQTDHTIKSMSGSGPARTQWLWRPAESLEEAHPDAVDFRRRRSALPPSANGADHYLAG